MIPRIVPSTCLSFKSNSFLSCSEFATALYHVPFGYRSKCSTSGESAIRLGSTVADQRLIMAGRRVEAAYDGQAIELGTSKGPVQSNGGRKISTSSRQARPGKATILAIGRAVPDVIVKNETLAEHYLQDFNIQDPVMHAKMRRLCKYTPYSHLYPRGRWLTVLSQSSC